MQDDLQDRLIAIPQLPPQPLNAIGECLRSAFTPGGTDLPQKIEALLDQLTTGGEG